MYRHPADVSRAVCAAYGDPVRFRVRQSVRAHRRRRQRKRLPADGGALARTEYHLAVHCAHAGNHGPLQFGLMHFYIGLAHGEDVTVGTLMYPFTSLKSVWAGIRMVFTLWLRGIIWSIVPTVIYSAIVFSVAVAVPRIRHSIR